MALRRLPRLVASTLLYSTVIGFGAISVNAWLRDADYDLSDVGQKAVTIEGVQRLVFLRGLNTFVPDPGSPMSEFVPYLRHKALRHLEPVEDYDQKLINEYGRVMGAAPVIASPPPDHSGEVRILMVAGLLAFVSGEVLLRFRAVMAMQTTGLVTPLLRSLGWGIRHCGVIAVHALVVRLALWAFGVALVVAPVVIAQCFGADVLAKVGLPRDLVSVPTMIASVALVNSVCTAFGAVYDARLYLRLVEHPC